MSGQPAWAVRVGASLLALHAWGAPQALAQSATTSAGDGAPSEAARRQALSPFRMILQNADAPRRAPVPAAPPPPKRAPPPAAEPTAAAPPRAPEPSPSPSPAPPPPPPPPVEQVTAVQPAAAAAKAPEPPPPIELVPLQQEAPVLAASLRREQPQGKVMVGFQVKPDGTTGDVRVVSTTDRRLNSASVTAVTGWRFKPIRQAQPVEVELVFGDQ